MLLSLLMTVAFAGPMTMFGGPATTTVAPTPPPTVVTAPTRGALFVAFPTIGAPTTMWATDTMGTEPDPPAFPPLPAPSGRKTAWQLGKTTIEQPGTFVRVDTLPSAFQPIEAAPDRLHRPDVFDEAPPQDDPREE